MNIVITGASGFVGGNLVGLLAAQGHRLLLVGRDPDRLAQAFPGHDCCGYDKLAERGRGCGRLVHLAVLNNNVSAGPEEFHRINVELTLEVAAKARQAGIARFVNVSSIHALDEANASAYAMSKREAVRQLASIDGIDIVSVYLPMVYGARWTGRLGALNKLPRPLARMLFSFLAALKPTVSVARIAEFVTADPAVDKDAAIIVSDGQGKNPWYKAAVRLVDLAFALIVLVPFSWALLVIWLIVKLQSPGPGVFAQKRIGKGAREFTCYKFRTMKLGTPQTGTHEASASAITSFGKFLRATKLDELPQAWNILRNEMTLIGPRPCLPIQTQLIEARRSRGVFEVKPGISGLAQVNDIDMSDPQKLAKWDERYIRLQCLILDLKIGLATVRGRGQGDKVAG
jgi:lipopolysaccharide/colanic/teichoic acid biosynthesis glycosyltransferase